MSVKTDQILAITAKIILYKWSTNKTL